MRGFAVSVGEEGSGTEGKVRKGLPAGRHLRLEGGGGWGAACGTTATQEDHTHGDNR